MFGGDRNNAVADMKGLLGSSNNGAAFACDASWFGDGS